MDVFDSSRGKRKQLSLPSKCAGKSGIMELESALSFASITHLFTNYIVKG